MPDVLPGGGGFRCIVVVAVRFISGVGVRRTLDL